ncbi:hypothetical protein CNX70_18545 [Janthinobacterium svalbardensis]|uniref:Uncharacterized protein n=1 Tax=Janthinobacterium svalbardensis TaxID=368607 RepID=A0A290WYC9_9BURK|nr:hypothetical protein CNX70_18545 [Janthinobacterium svalbardensis]
MLAPCMVGTTFAAMPVIRISMSLGSAVVFMMRLRVGLSGTGVASHESNSSPLQREGCYQNPEQVADK